MRTPVELLKPHQSAIYADESRFVAWIAGRQIGKSFTGAAKCVKWAKSAAKTDVVVASPSERQSIEAVAKCKDWARAFDFAIEEELEERDAPKALLKSDTIIFPNGSRIIAVPGKPDTVRGFSAHVWADEFAFFEDPAATWKALFPCISNELRGKKKVMLTSTPNGKSGRGRRFWEIVTNKGRVEQKKTHYAAAEWSIYRTPITEAAKWLGTDVEELRRAIDDEEAWRQEFLCEFIDGSTVLLPYELIAKCESATARTEAEEVLEKPALYVAGIDFGRTNDPTVMWILERTGEEAYTTAGVIVVKSENTVDQFATLAPFIEKCQRVCVDFTGPGVGFGDMAAKKFGGAKTHEMRGDEKVELCLFTAPFKADIFPKMKTALDGAKIALPIDVDCREDLHEMQQRHENGRVSYEAKRTKEGHSDRCTALALAWRAAQSVTGAACEPPDEDEQEIWERTWA